MSSIQTLFENNNIKDLTREELVEIDQLLTEFQSKPICGVITTRKIAKLMVEKAKDSITNNGADNTVLSTPVGTVINDLLTHYTTGINNSSTTAETYYSTTTSEFANPMVSIFDAIPTQG